MITKGLVLTDVDTFEKDPRFQVLKYPLALKIALVMNHRGIMANKNFRKAIRHGIDRSELLKYSYKDTMRVSTEFYPVACFPTGAAPDNPAYDPTLLEDIVRTLPSKQLTIGAAGETGAAGLLAAEFIQVQLQSAGLDATVRQVNSTEEFTLYQAAPSQRPDMLLCVRVAMS